MTAAFTALLGRMDVMQKKEESRCRYPDSRYVPKTAIGRLKKKIGWKPKWKPAREPRAVAVTFRNAATAAAAAAANAAVAANAAAGPPPAAAADVAGKGEDVAGDH